MEFDLRGIFEGNQYAEFALVYRLLHASRFPCGGAGAADSLIERYYQAGIEQGGRVRERLREGVEAALRSLGQGLLRHPQSGPLREALGSGRLDAAGYYRQLLRLVYRLLFLMAAEERRLLFPAEGAGGALRAYQRYYSVGALRDRCERRFGGGSYHDLWLGLLQTFLIFRSEEQAAPLGMTPLDSELFNRAACADLERARCGNDDLLQTMRNLSTFMDDDGGGIRRRVNYAALDVEELGSVYEALLELRPRIDPAPAQGGYPTFELVAGSERKQTGSYYTPPDLVQELIESALAPLIRERLAAAGTAAAQEKALLDLRVLDPASGSGHFLLAAARRIARELAQVRAGGGSAGPDAYRAALREVIRHCIYAVDKNPLAVDLCKVALWIESHSPGLALSFLDHHIKCGDSLVGVGDFEALNSGVPDGAYKAVDGDDKKAAKAYRERNRQERIGQRRLGLGDHEETVRKLADELESFSALEERGPGDVQAKEQLYAELRGRGTRWWEVKTACDLWTYAFFAPLQPPGADQLDHAPTSNDVRQALAGLNVSAQLRGEATAESMRLRFFHWPLEFPDIFERGGFDVVLGNPPWDQVQLEEKEFFAGRDEEIVNASNKAERQRLIDQLPTCNPELAREFAQARHRSYATSRFVRKSGRFPLAGRGKINSYSIFSETARTLISSAGRVGMIVPTGIATDDTTKQFFTDLVNSRELVSLLDFENRYNIFPGIASNIRFCLLTLTGHETPSEQADFAFFLHSTEHLIHRERRFTLTQADFALFNPNTRTAPTFRTRRDAAIARKIYHRAGVLWQEAKHGTAERNPWGVHFHTMFNMSTDSVYFRTYKQLTDDGYELNGNVFMRGDERYLPLYEAKLFHQYDHRYATFEGVEEGNRKRGNARTVEAAEKEDSDSVILPRYWISAEKVAERLEKYERVEAASITEPNRTEPNRTEPNRTEPVGSVDSRNWFANRSQKNRSVHRRANEHPHHDPGRSLGRLWDHHDRWLAAFRDIARATDKRTAIATVLPGYAVNDKAPLIRITSVKWLQVLRSIARATDMRTTILSHIQESGLSHSSYMITYERAKAVASALVLANMNSLPLDWAARMSVGGVNMNFFIVKQLPVLPPEAYLEEGAAGASYAELVAPRVLELTYTSHELSGFARDLGYEGGPFRWDEGRRHQLKCELDAIYARMYQLERDELEWILDAPEPSASFPVLKRAELAEFGEYRTQRYVLAAYDQLAAGRPPDLSGLEDGG